MRPDEKKKLYQQFIDNAERELELARLKDLYLKRIHLTGKKVENELGMIQEQIKNQREWLAFLEEKMKELCAI